MEKNNNIKYIHLNQKKVYWTLLSLLFIAFVLRVWGISFGLPGIDHGDETEVVNHAVRFGSGDLNPHRFQYGSLFQYILFVFYGVYFLIGYLLGKFSSVHQFAIHFINDPTDFYLIARGLSALFGTATLVITYLIGKRVKNDETGLLAALFLAFSYQHVIHSHYCTVDIALAFFFTLAVYQCLILFYHDHLARYILAGVSIGLVLATKFNGVFASIAFICAHFLKKDDRNFIRKIVCKKLWVGICSIFIGHFIACPYFYIEFDSALVEIVQLRALHAFSGFHLGTYLREFSKAYWGIPLGTLCILGLIRSIITTDRKILMLASTASAVLCFASLHRYVEAKYVVYSFPLFALFASFLLMECFARLQKRYLYLIVLLLVLHPIYLIIDWDYYHVKKSITLEAKEWIEENIPVGSKILLDNVGNAGPKLNNSPQNIHNQYKRALTHNLLKAEYLKLKLELSPSIYYNIIQINCSAGFRKDDYQRYRLWQDVEEIGSSLVYYQEKGFDYIVVTDRYFSQIEQDFALIKEFKRGRRGIRIYKVMPIKIKK